MATAAGSLQNLNFIEETVYGTTPATPAFNNFRVLLGSSAELEKNGIVSQEMRSDRNISDFRHGNRIVGGDLPFELSYTTFDDALEAVMCGTWAVDTPGVGIDQLKNGITRRSFTLEYDYPNLTDRYERFTGVQFNTFTLEVAPDSMVTGGFGIIGQNQAFDTTIITGATYGAATTTEPFDSFTGTINEGGIAIAVVTGISLSIDNGLEALPVVGSDLTLEPGIGRFNVTGNLTAYFQNDDLSSKFLTETESSLDFTLQDAAGNTLFFDIPALKFSTASKDRNEKAMTVSLDFQGTYSTADAATLIVQRNPA